MEQQTIEAWFQASGLEFRAELVHFDAVDTSGDRPWRHDAWRVTFARGKVAESFDYKTGTGHRVKSNTWSDSDTNGAVGYAPGGGPRNAARLATPADGYRQPFPYYCDHGSRWFPVAPNPLDVLDSLRSDAGAIEQTFTEWAEELGYSTDSIAALATYNACRDAAQQIIRLVGLEGLATLRACEPR